VPPPAVQEPPATSPKRRNPIPFVIAGVVLLAMLGFGVRQYLFGRTHVSSDNAQVEGHIVPVLPKAAGFVTEVRVRDNQQVKAGDVLVVIDDRDYKVRLEQAEADLGVAEANAGEGRHTGQAEAQVAAARAAVTEAQAGAWRTQVDLERYRELAARGVIGRQQLDNAEAAAKSAAARLEAAKQQVGAAAAGLTGAEARVAASRAARDQAALNLSYTKVVAPTDGVVSKKTVEVGQLVQVGQPLMAVVPLDDVWVVANLKETEVRDVTPGDRAEITVDAYPGRKFRGRVESLSPASGARFSLLPPDNATGNFTKVVQRIPVKIALDGPADPKHPLRPGMSVEAVVTTH
jgi:membrane fusion protein (multidrug efflux system)